MPGMLNTVSVNTAPPSSTPRSMPRITSRSAIAERMPLLHDDVALAQPLARAVRTSPRPSPRAGSTTTAARRSPPTTRPARSRQDHRLEPRARVAGQAMFRIRVVAGQQRDAAERLVEQVEHHQPEPVDRRGDRDQRQAHRRPVEQRSSLQRARNPDGDRHRQPHDDRAERMGVAGSRSDQSQTSALLLRYEVRSACRTSRS